MCWTKLNIQLAESQTKLEHLAILSLKMPSNQQKSNIWGTLNLLLCKYFILNIPKSFFYDIHFFVIQVSAVMFCLSPVTCHMSLMTIDTTTDLTPGNSLNMRNAADDFLPTTNKKELPITDVKAQI